MEKFKSSIPVIGAFSLCILLCFMLVEQVETNKQLAKLVKVQSAISEHYKNVESRRIVEQRRVRKSLGQARKGILKQEDFN